MKITAALTHEQGQDFVIVLVKDRVIASPSERENMLAFAQETFGVRAALLSERQSRTWSAHRDIVRWLETVSIEQLPWKQYSYIERAA